MILTIASLGLSALIPLAGGQDTAAIEAAAPTAPGPVLQIRASEIHVGDGTVISNGVVIVQNGRITKVGADVAIDDKHPVIHHDGVLSAGMIACHSQMSVKGDDFEEARSIVPEARISHAIRPDHPHFQKALAAGITTIVVSPSEENLVGGLTAVVKTADGAVAKDGAHLAMSFTHAALSAGQMPFFFFFAADGAAQAEEGGLENTDSGSSGARYPTSYSGAIRELGTRLADPVGVMTRVAKGELPVMIEAWDRHEVSRAARFAERFGLRGAVRGAPLAGDKALLAQLAKSKLGVVLGPFAANQTHRSLAGVAALQEAGIPLAFALTGNETSPETLRVSAVRAIGAGANPAGLWKALTSDAAKIAGVGDRVGLVAPGRDADLVFWSGHPLNLTSQVEAVYVNGKRVYEGASR